MKPVKPGHNSGIAHDQVRQYVERIERLEAEKADIAADIREVYAEAKGNSVNVKVLRKVIARRKLSADERNEQDMLLDIYEGVFA